MSHCCSLFTDSKPKLSLSVYPTDIAATVGTDVTIAATAINGQKLTWSKGDSEGSVDKLNLIYSESQVDTVDYNRVDDRYSFYNTSHSGQTGMIIKNVRPQDAGRFILGTTSMNNNRISVELVVIGKRNAMTTFINWSFIGDISVQRRFYH